MLGSGGGGVVVRRMAMSGQHTQTLQAPRGRCAPAPISPSSKHLFHSAIPDHHPNFRIVQTWLSGINQLFEPKSERRYLSLAQLSLVNFFLTLPACNWLINATTSCLAKAAVWSCFSTATQIVQPPTTLFQVWLSHRPESQISWGWTHQSRLHHLHHLLQNKPAR